MYKDKKRCKKCMYGWMPNGQPTYFVPVPMCLYYHDTGQHRDGNDDICNSFKKLTKETIMKRIEESHRRFRDGETFY